MADPQTPDLIARIDELERRQRRSDPRAGIETIVWSLVRNVFPEETRHHMKAAGREQLLAARSYLDHWIGKMGESQAAEQPTRETIEVE